MNITHKQYFNVSNASFVQTVKTISRSTFLFIKLNSFIILCIFVRTVKPRYLYKNKSFNVTSVITSAKQCTDRKCKGGRTPKGWKGKSCVSTQCINPDAPNFVEICFQLPRQTPSGRKVRRRKKKKKKERIMPCLVATTSALARTTCVRTHSVRTNLLSSNNQMR